MKIGVLPSFPDWWPLLTPDEQRIVQLIITGLTNRQIAEGLNVTEEAIKNHILVIFRKTGCENRLELALAMHRGQ
jgi:DNA-binding NarL/FixJ family response regulator